MQPNDKPRGAELTVVRAFKKMEEPIRVLCARLDAAMPSATEFSVAVDFSRDGVRTNGDQRLHTIIEALDVLTLLSTEIAHGLKAYQHANTEIIRLTEQGRRLMGTYQRCSQCKGEKGKKVRESYGWRWQDCLMCHGRGFVQRKPDE